MTFYKKVLFVLSGIISGRRKTSLKLCVCHCFSKFTKLFVMEHKNKTELSKKKNTLNYEEYKKNFGENISKFDPKGYPKTIKISPHQLRHTYATLLYYSNMDPLTTSKLLGHTTVDFTLNTYTHLDEKNKTLDISSFNKYISEELGRT